MYENKKELLTKLEFGSVDSEIDLDKKLQKGMLSWIILN